MSWSVVDLTVPSRNEPPPLGLLFIIATSRFIPTIRNDPFPLHPNKGEIHKQVDWNEGIMDRGIMSFAHCCAGCGVYCRSGASTLVGSRASRGFNGIFLCLYDVYEFTNLYLSYMLCMTTGWMLCDANLEYMINNRTRSILLVSIRSILQTIYPKQHIIQHNFRPTD